VKSIEWIKGLCEYLGGQRDDPPGGIPIQLSSALWGLWWGVLGCVVAVFCGQSSKFIYIDF